jgi:hypothetical protein
VESFLSRREGKRGVTEQFLAEQGFM